MASFNATPTPVGTLPLATTGVSTLVGVNGSGSPVQITSPIKSDGHSFSYGNLYGNGWDGASDYQAFFGQTQSTYLSGGSLGAVYGQRIASYTGGAADDASTPTTAAVRGYTQIGTGVTYCNESGGLFVSDNYSYLGQSVGIFGQANSYHGGRTFGLEAEAKEFPETFTATAGQTVFAVPNGYTANKAIVFKNGTLLTRTTNYVDSSGTNIVLTAGATAGDTIKVVRGDPVYATIGGEVIAYAAGGTDQANPISGNRVGLAISGYRSLAGSHATEFGTLLTLNSAPGDSTFTTLHGLLFQGKFKTAIDFTASNFSATDWMLRFGTYSGVTAAGNLAIGNIGTYDVAGYGTMMLGHSTNGGLFRFGDGTAMGRILCGTAAGFSFGTETNLDVQFHTNGSEKWRLLSAGGLRPSADNAYSLGTGSFRVSVVYAGTGTINTSDARLKQDVRPLDDAEKRVAIKCRDLVRAYRFIDAVQEKGDGARFHFGVIAQDIEGAFISEGLDPWRYGILCSDRVLGARRVSITRRVPKTETITQTATEVVIENGTAVLRKTEQQIEQQCFEEFNVVDENGGVLQEDVYDTRPVEMLVPDMDTLRKDENGNDIVDMKKRVSERRVLVGSKPMVHREPVFQEVEEEISEEYDTGETRLGIRYEELLCFIMAAG